MEVERKSPKVIVEKIDTNSMSRIRPFRRSRSRFFPRSMLRRNCQKGGLVLGARNLEQETKESDETRADYWVWSAGSLQPLLQTEAVITRGQQPILPRHGGLALISRHLPSPTGVHWEAWGNPDWCDPRKEQEPNCGGRWELALGKREGRCSVKVSMAD